jgi:hypothetical protein
LGVPFVDVSTTSAGAEIATLKADQAGSSSETTVTGNSCWGVFHGIPPGSLVVTTSAGPNGSLIAPGQTITVMLTWNLNDFSGKIPSKTDDCVKIGSTNSPTLSQEHKPGPGGGIDTFTDVVPVSGTGGQPLCIRGSVSGSGTNTEKSSVLCYSILGAATPEVPSALLLPLAGLLVGGCALLIMRRRASRAGVETSSQLS